jgi:hypothetical protein
VFASLSTPRSRARRAFSSNSRIFGMENSVPLWVTGDLGARGP